jgi:MSHA pilin protein MshB
MLNISQDAEDATVEGVAGGFASAVQLVKAQWEIEGRPRAEADINLDGTTMDVGTNGFPTGVSDADETNMDASDCLEVWNSIMQSPPPATTNAQIEDERYYVTVNEDVSQFNSQNNNVTPNSTGIDLCVYYLIATLDTKTTGEVPTEAQNGEDLGNLFKYNPSTGQVAIVSNN